MAAFKKPSIKACDRSELFILLRILYGVVIRIAIVINSDILKVMHTVLHKGEFKKVDKLDDDHLALPSTNDFFAMPANMITGISGVSGGRVLLSSKATLQSIPLVNRERPLVESTAYGQEESTQDKFGKHYLSVTATKPGKVTHIDDDSIIVKDHDGKEQEYQLYHNFNLGRKSFISHTPKVHLGDQVKANDILATSNYTDKEGHLALGINLTTAIMPYRGDNFEDAFAVSESGAKKLAAEQMMKFHIEKKFGVETGKDKFISLFPNKYTNDQLSKIDSDGIIKVGSTVEHSDPVILALSPKALKSTDLALGKLSKVLKHAYRDNSEAWDYEHGGKVVDVAKHNDLVTVHIVTKRELLPGDKLSNLYGAKGVVCILPDSQCPTLPDGKPVDIMLNSMSITSRVAPALAVTLGIGKLAEKQGKTVNMSQFPKGSAIKDVIADLKKHDISDTEKLYDPMTGKHIEAVVGPLYYFRLTHISEDKLSGRSQGTGYDMNNQPTKSGTENSKRIGALGTAALLSHNAKSVLEDLGTVKGTKNDEFWTALKLGQTPPAPKVPFIFNKFVASLQGAGINVTRKGNEFNIMPMIDKDTVAVSQGPINKATMFKPHQDELVHEVGGLFDPNNVGIFGDRYNHVDLNMPVPNPISEDYLRKLLEVTKKDYDSLVVSGEISNKLAAINTDSKIAEMKKYIESGKKTKRDDAAKLLQFLTALKSHNLQPKDLILHKVAIIPAQYRPVSKMGDTVLTSDVNFLYKDLILNNNALKDTKNVPQEVVDKLKAGQYAAVKAVYGLGDPINKKHADKNIKGLLATMFGLKGGTAKSTMFQSKVVNKSLDLVGRAVITPDARLDVDQASMPQDLLWQVYKPFLIRRLVLKGVPAVQAAEYIKKKNPMAIQAMNEELLHRPGIISRDPAWHKFNLMGFHMIPNANPSDRTIRLNPLVFKGYNADADGDQVNINIPAIEAARKEVLLHMLPSKNLISPKNFQPILLPSNESALGLYGLSTENKHNTAKKFKTELDAVKAYHKGELEAGDNLEIG